MSKVASSFYGGPRDGAALGGLLHMNPDDWPAVLTDHAMHPEGYYQLVAHTCGIGLRYEWRVGQAPPKTT